MRDGFSQVVVRPHTFSYGASHLSRCWDKLLEMKRSTRARKTNTGKTMCFTQEGDGLQHIEQIPVGLGVWIWRQPSSKKKKIEKKRAGKSALP